MDLVNATAATVNEFHISKETPGPRRLPGGDPLQRSPRWQEGLHGQADPARPDGRRDHALPPISI